MGRRDPVGLFVSKLTTAMDTVKPQQVRDCKMERKIQDAWPTTERQLGRMSDNGMLRHSLGGQ